MLDNTFWEKYIKGECSAEEIKQIQQWLEDRNDVPELESSQHLEDIGNEIWASIRPAETTRRHRLLSPRYWASAAAAILVLGALSFYILSNRSVHNDGYSETVFSATDDTETYHFADLNFRLSQDSRVAIKSGESGIAANIFFCGAVEIANESNRDLTYSFESSCKESQYTRKEITFKAGKTYVAIHNFYKDDEIIIIRKDNLAGMPDAITAMVAGGFDNIQI